MTPAVPPDTAPGLAEAVRDAALRRPDTTVMTFVDYAADRSGTTTELTYGGLDRRARAIAGALGSLAAPGERAAILCPHGADYVVALLGCLYAGVLAVPLYAPESLRPDDRPLLAMADCAPRVALTTRPYEESVRGLLAGDAGAAAGRPEVVCVDAVDASGADGAAPPAPARPDDTAYLQYTSGSTRAPAGVLVTHRNLAVGVAQLARGLDIGDDAQIVGWLPFFHDMGLLFTVAVPLITGTPAVLMAPFAFIQQPVRWLRALTAHRATHTVSPNFGLDLCVNRVAGRHREGLDLSSLRCLVNGSEPVRATTLERFTEAFAPYGFRARAHSPGYGLAEATLAVTLSGPGPARVLTVDRKELAADRVRPLPEGDTGGYRVVGCGTPADQELRIVDPRTGEPVAEDGVGEVWVRGANVCAGYWNRPERTAAVFRARPHPDGDDGRTWLRTGDLGFLRDGELYPTGRLKDLIVVDGRNHHPVDLELTVEEAAPAVRRGHVAAFPVGLLDDAGERVVVVAELDREREAGDQEAVRTAIRAAVLARHSLELADVVLIRRGCLPKTTSGKVRRTACRDRYEDGSLKRAGTPTAPAARAAAGEGTTAP
ncbi:fatty acyl-AMP ligase [Streptomyces sp. OE57]|uniref:fatty acyl-AMP ligase n=1 Tax=Streptomyces lacaronensis TaxID=3379885 RepID=UPI0039B78540